MHFKTEGDFRVATKEDTLPQLGVGEGKKSHKRSTRVYHGRRDKTETTEKSNQPKSPGR